MRRGRHLHVAVLAALAVSSGLQRPAHAQGALQAFPQAGGSVFLTWQAVPDPAVAGYNVYRRQATLTADKATLANPQPLTATTMTDTGLTLGTPVIYFVRTVYKDSAGKLSEGSQSSDAAVTPQNPLALPAGNFFYWNIQTANPGSVTLDASKVLTIRASGADLWDTTDGQTFVGMPVSGDYQLTAEITEQPVNDPGDDNPNDWSKFGVEVRAGPFRGDPFGIVFTSANRDPGVLFEGHTTFWGGVTAGGANFSDGGSAQSDTKFPLYLRLLRQGSMITAFESFDDKTYTQVGSAHDYGSSLPLRTYAGVFTTAARDGQYAIGKFNATSIKIEAK